MLTIATQYTNVITSKLLFLHILLIIFWHISPSITTKLPVCLFHRARADKETVYLTPEQKYLPQTARDLLLIPPGITSNSDREIACVCEGLFFTRSDSSNPQQSPVGRNICLCVIIWQRGEEWLIEMLTETPRKQTERQRRRVIESVMDGETEQETNDTVWNRDCSLRMTLLGVNRSIHEPQTKLEAAKLIYNTFRLMCGALPVFALLVLCANANKLVQTQISCDVTAVTVIITAPDTGE